ncbi:SpoIIE family protein phosphatase [Streptomyces sp. SID8366]|uniref:SpoIIE family protein phosphatase n=2 Tax=Streptomyces TaxID=1883 RepID=UPI000DBA3AA1|nr:MULTISPECIES: SpoIIE family protein phosphatase [Streptomyces]MYU08050.1 SpoIIE family protein phosphatase [Streptomyces sp. SID8366]RAJ59244.1 PAS domain S-box-containing protein [Streptomyces sp. PsTaAH-130]TXJ76243.1 PAS domain S-box protein [Streptomyces lavendulae]
MSAAGAATEGGEPARGPVPPGGLLDVLAVASVVLDTDGRIVLWSPQAEELFGYTAAEALGQYAARLMVDERHMQLVGKLFADVMATGQSWAGGFPIRHKDGGTRLVEFRNMRLLDARGKVYALGLAADRSTVRRLEQDVALSERMVMQSPAGLAVLDTELRFVSVNPALERINGRPAAEHLGRRMADVVPELDIAGMEAGARRVLETGAPLIDHIVVGRTPADPDAEHTWAVSLYRLDDAAGHVLGVACSVADITEQHRAAREAEAARRRLAVIADAGARIGTTLELDRTARELAEVAVPELADVAAVDLLEAVVEGRPSTLGPADAAVLRALALRPEDASDAVRAADTPGRIARYAPDRLVTECVRTGEAVLVPRVKDEDLPRIARSPEAAVLLGRAGLHSYLAVPLIARGEVLGALDLKRTVNARPFDADDVLLARELAARAAVQIDNARWYQNARNTALTLQRSLLPSSPPVTTGLEVASRYQPAGATSEVGGDWFDVIPLEGGRTALVVGDVMGSGIGAAATMGRLRTATTTLTALGLDPAVLLAHLDKTTSALDHSIATCVYAVHDPRLRQCRIANAGHLPPARIRPGRPPELLDLPTGVPLGVGGVSFSTVTVDFAPGDELVLYTDGLVETRHHTLDERLDLMLSLLTDPTRPLEETCDLLLRTLHHPDNHDDVALLIARAKEC